MTSPRMRPSYYVPADGLDRDAITRGLTWGVRVATAHGDHEVTLVASDLRSLDRGSIPDAIGAPVADRLKRDRVVLVGTGMRLRLVTADDRGQDRVRGTVVAVDATPHLLQALDAEPHVTALIVVPRLRRDIASWVRTWQAQADITDRAETAPTRRQNPVVAAALVSLTVQVNLATGLGHPSDHSAAVHLFRILRDGHEPIAFAELPAMLVALGWTDAFATAVTELGKAVYAGQRIPAGTSPWQNDVLAYWRGTMR